MKTVRLAVFLMVVISLTACSGAAAQDVDGEIDTSRVDALTQRIETLEAQLSTYADSAVTGDELAMYVDQVDELTLRVATLEQALSEMSAGAEPQPAETVASPEDLEPDYAVYSDIEDLLSLLPASYAHPFPVESIEKAVLIQDDERTQIVVVYNEVIAGDAVEAMAGELGGELEAFEQALGGSPGWRIETGSVNYHVQLVDPEGWYDGFVESDVWSTAIYVELPASSVPDLSPWFNPVLFAYDDYLMPDLLSQRTPQLTAVIVGNGEDVSLESVSVWRKLTPDNIVTILDHYGAILKDHEWFMFEGDAMQFASIFAKLDLYRSIFIKTMPDWDDTMMCRIRIAHAGKE